MFSESNFTQVKISDYQNIHYPTFFEGMATIADLRGKLFDLFIEQIFKTRDEDAIRSDWEKTGEDFKDAISRTRVDFLKHLSQSPLNASDDVSEELQRNAFTRAMTHNLSFVDNSGKRT